CGLAQELRRADPTLRDRSHGSRPPMAEWFAATRRVTRAVRKPDRIGTQGFERGVRRLLRAAALPGLAGALGRGWWRSTHRLFSARPLTDKRRTARVSRQER